MDTPTRSPRTTPLITHVSPVIKHVVTLGTSVVHRIDVRTPHTGDDAATVPVMDPGSPSPTKHKSRPPPSPSKHSLAARSLVADPAG